MKSVQIYKDDIRQHILRSLVFTDKVLIILGGAIIAGGLFAVFRFGIHIFSWHIFIITLIFCEAVYLWGIMHKIDNQSLYKIIPRAIRFKSSRKQFRAKEIDPYFTDFTIQDNHIFRNNTVIKMYEVEPYDIALLNEQDREHFFVKLKQMIHTLPSQVQFIVKKEQMRLSDISKHIFSLYEQSNRKREAIIDRYVDDLSSLIKTSQFMTIRYYAVFSAPCDPSNSSDKIKAINSLNDMGSRFAASMAACDISVLPLENNQLIDYMQQTLR